MRKHNRKIEETKRREGEKMKKGSKFLRFLVVLCVIFLVVLYVPSDKKTITPEQKEELSFYITQINERNTQREDVLNLYEQSVLNEEETSKAYRSLEEDVLPMFENYQQNSTALVLKDKAIQEVHQQYLLAVKTQHTSFTQYVEAYQTQQENLYEEANALLEKSNQAYKTFDQHLRKLAKEYDISLPSQAK